MRAESEYQRDKTNQYHFIKRSKIYLALFDVRMRIARTKSIR